MHADTCALGIGTALTLAGLFTQVCALQGSQQHCGMNSSPDVQSSSALQQQLQQHEIHITRLPQQMLEMQGGGARHSGYAHPSSMVTVYEHRTACAWPPICLPILRFWVLSSSQVLCTRQCSLKWTVYTVSALKVCKQCLCRDKGLLQELSRIAPARNSPQALLDVSPRLIADFSPRDNPPCLEYSTSETINPMAGSLDDGRPAACLTAVSAASAAAGRSSTDSKHEGKTSKPVPAASKGASKPKCDLLSKPKPVRSSTSHASSRTSAVDHAPAKRLQNVTIRRSSTSLQRHSTAVGSSRVGLAGGWNHDVRLKPQPTAAAAATAAAVEQPGPKAGRKSAVLPEEVDGKRSLSSRSVDTGFR